MAWLDLAELEEVFRGRWFWSTRGPAVVWMRRADYLGDADTPLADAVRALVERETGSKPAGAVRVLTNLRHFGHCFNPVSFYYCYDAANERVETVLAEITNTPWNERHAYVLPAGQSLTPGPDFRFRFGKRFHVSPFMPMDVDYDWRFSSPGERLAVHMTNLQGGSPVFDATLALRRREISGTALAGTLLRYPLPSLRVLGAIYWQALRLWTKGTPFHIHPAKRVGETAT
jgi:DUF1365 family protein